VIAAATAAVVVAADQATKAWALAELKGEPSISVLGDFLQWTFATNSGAAFSLGAGGATWIITALAAVAMVAIVWFVWRTTNRWWALALGLLFGGAMGNFIDRWLQPPYRGQGHVVDFIDVGTFPIFNIADIAVVSGAALMAWLSLREVDYRSRSAEPDGDQAQVAAR
jgi:signal peptidase II